MVTECKEIKSMLLYTHTLPVICIRVIFVEELFVLMALYITLNTSKKAVSRFNANCTVADK